MSPIAAVALIGVMAGAGAMWVFRRASDGMAIRAAVNRIEARLLEFWLFVDEPAAIWGSWRGLVGANARLLRLLLRPLAILTVLMLPPFLILDSAFGTAPLPVGKPAVATVQFDQPLEQIAPIPELRAPDGIVVESPPVRVFSERQVSWRIRPLRAVTRSLHWELAGRKVEVAFPPATLLFLGMEAHWSVWFLAFALIGSLLLGAAQKWLH